MPLHDVSKPNDLGDGWVGAEAWTYASADAPTFTFTVAADVTQKYWPGMRVKLTQSGVVAYFIITAVSTFSGGVTTITVYGGTDYTLANTTISSPYYSVVKAPFGFPLDPTKWTVTATDTTGRVQSSPVSGTWYNLGSFSLSIPIGAWDVSYSVCAVITRSGAGNSNVWTTLSTANNTESDPDFTALTAIDNTDFVFDLHIARKPLVVTSNTPYFLNTKSTSTSVLTVENTNSNQKAIIRAVCAYL